MGKMIPIITKAIKAGNIKLEDNKYIVSGEETIVLNNEDILVSYIAKSNKPVLSDDKIVVSLDLTITDELKKEGIAREIVRNIQDARKQLELNITDKIEICLIGDYPIEHAEYICKETLGKLSSFGEEEANLSLETEGIKVLIKK